MSSLQIIRRCHHDFADVEILLFCFAFVVVLNRSLRGTGLIVRYCLNCIPPNCLCRDLLFTGSYFLSFSSSLFSLLSLSTVCLNFLVYINKRYRPLSDVWMLMFISSLYGVKGRKQTLHRSPFTLSQLQSV